MQPADALSTFRRDGYLRLEGLFAKPTIERARLGIEQLFYGMPFEAWLGTIDPSTTPEVVPDGIVSFADHRRSRWPTGIEPLDRLIENEAMLDTAALLLGDAPLYAAGTLFLRAAPTDRRFPPDPYSGWHFDHFNNGLLPPSPVVGRYEYINVVVYLNDVDEASAPTLLLPGTHTRAAELAHSQLAAGNFVEGSFGDVRQLGPLPDAVPATGAAGTVLFYSSFLIHTAQPFADRQRQRAFWTLSLGRRDNAAWSRHTNPFDYSNREFTRHAIARSTARVRTLLGWPPPGDAYYTATTMAILAMAYPGIDLAPYRAAMA